MNREKVAKIVDGLCVFGMGLMILAILLNDLEIIPKSSWTWVVVGVSSFPCIVSGFFYPTTPVYWRVLELIVGALGIWISIVELLKF